MTTVRWKRFTAEVLFVKPNDVPRAIEALAAADCEFEYNPDRHRPVQWRSLCVEA
jgi:hypothetical protein